MSDRVCVALCGVPAGAATRIAVWLQEHPGLGLAVGARADSPEALLESLHSSPAHAVVIDSLLGLEGISLGQELMAAGYRAVAVVDAAGRALVRQRAAELGLTVLPDYEPAKATALLRRLVGLSQEGAPGGGRIIACHGVRGGAGTSVLALTLALSLARQGARTALVETCSSASVLPMLGLKAGGGWIELLPALTPDLEGNPHGPATVARCLLTTQPGGEADLALLPTGGPLVMDQVGAEETELVLNLLPACGFDYIVVDTGAELTIPSAATLAAAHAVCLVAAPDAVSAHRLVQTQEVLAHLGVADGQVLLVVNRVKESLPQPLVEVLQFLRCRRPLQIPHENKRPLDTTGRFAGFKPGSQAARAIEGLVQSLREAEPEVTSV
jgi:MinD-like ATPase involved in chromosome partitioning or flagellar assembly